jgi:pyridoxal phosphate enzyme (YggS family)
MIKDFSGVIVCASKYFSADEIRKLYNLGIRDFGENKVQDLLSKKQALKDLNINWHFIGRLQSNKVKDLINEITLLHTLSTASAAKEINKYAKEVKNVLIQLNLTDENQKSGVNQENLAVFIKDLQKYDKINIVGFMTMGKLDNVKKTEEAFQKLDELATKYNYKIRSMGMSGDYILAIKHHATHLRIGSLFKKYL